MVPKGWSRHDLGSILEFKNGINTDAGNYGHGTKFVNVMDVLANEALTYDQIGGSVSITDGQQAAYALRRGDILFNRTSETREEIAFAAVYLDDKPAVFGGFVIRGRPTNNLLDFSFSKYCFRAASVRREMTRRCQGAIRANIGQGDMSEISILLPPLEEQKEIARLLSAWDRAIATVEKLIENNQRQKKALLETLLVGKARLRGFGAPAPNGSFPKDWKFITLAKVGRWITGLTYSPGDVVDDEGLLVLRSSNIGGSEIKLEDKVFVRTPVPEESLTRVGDILIAVRNGSRNLIGKNAVIDGSCAGMAHGAFMTLYRSEENYYLSHVFQSDMFVQQVNRNLGATINSINISHLNKFKFPFPPKEERRAIAAVLSASSREIVTLRKYLAYLYSEKDVLVQLLLAGELRVKSKGKTSPAAKIG